MQVCFSCKHRTAYEMRISDWSSDVCSSGLTNTPLKLVDEVTSLGVMLTLVGAGYGIGFAIASQVQTLQRPDISIRPLAGIPPMLSTYLLRRRSAPPERSEERRVGKECVSTFRSRWWPYN